MYNLQGNDYPGGLLNLGNTCYANAVLQVLCYTPGLYDHLRKVVLFLRRIDRVRSVLKEHVPESAQEKLALPLSCAFVEQLFKVFRTIRVERRSCRPAPLLRILRQIHCAFTPGEEHDAQELLLCALDAVQSAMRDLQTFRTSLIELARGLGDQPGCLTVGRLLPLPQRFAGACSLAEALTVPDIQDADGDAAAAVADSDDAPLLRLEEDADAAFSVASAGFANVPEDDPLLLLSATDAPVSSGQAEGADRAASTPSPPSPNLSPRDSPGEAGEDGAGPAGADLRPSLPSRPAARPQQQAKEEEEDDDDFPRLALRQMPTKSFSRKWNRDETSFDRAFGADAFKLRGGARANRLIGAAESPRRPLGQQNLADSTAAAAAAAAATSAAVAAVSAAVAGKRHLGAAVDSTLPALLMPATLQSGSSNASASALPKLSAAVAAINADRQAANDENLGASPLKRPRCWLSSSTASVNSAAPETAQSVGGEPGFTLTELVAQIEALDIGDPRLHDFVGRRMTGQQQYTTRCLECEAETVKCQPFSIISCPVRSQRRGSSSADVAGPSAATAAASSAASTSDGFESPYCGEVRTLVAEPDSQLNLSADSDADSELPFPHCALQEEERLTGDDKFLCDRCNELQEASLRLTYGCLPHVLCLHLKRFSLDSRGCVTKINDPVQIPAEFSHCEPDGTDRKYELYAIIIHDGLTISSGHYTSLVRLPDSGRGGGCWFSFDDDFVRPVGAFQLAAALSPSQAASKTPYVVLYSAVPFDT